MVAISNLNYAMPGGMLTTWAEGVKRAGVKNAMVVALDDEAKLMAEQQGLAGFQMQLEVNKQAAACNVSKLHCCNIRWLVMMVLQWP